jgi:nitrite reductase/ring-hydroxylating ferredoxin subunit
MNNNAIKNAKPVLKLIGCFLLLLAAGCGKEDNHPEIPDVPVSFAIDPNSTEYNEISHIGGWIYLTGGYNGILVYRSEMTVFMAYDRACPYDFQENNARIVVEVSGITCACPVCGSKYIITDGTPFEGPSRYMLKQYRTTYDGSLLYIYN